MREAGGLPGIVKGHIAANHGINVQGLRAILSFWRRSRADTVDKERLGVWTSGVLSGCLTGLCMSLVVTQVDRLKTIQQLQRRG
jgi:hypothetical protein